MLQSLHAKWLPVSWLHKWFSEGGPLISSVSITWGPVRSHSGPSDSEMLGVGPSNLYFHKFSGDSDAPLGLGAPGFMYWNSVLGLTWAGGCHSVSSALRRCRWNVLNGPAAAASRWRAQRCRLSPEAHWAKSHSNALCTGVPGLFEKHCVVGRIMAPRRLPALIPGTEYHEKSHLCYLAGKGDSVGVIKVTH